MNPRIRELAEQAAGNFTENFKWDYLLEIDKDIFEKFAELIVRECARIATATPCPYEDEYNRIIFGHTWDMASIEAGREIVKHFGVE